MATKAVPVAEEVSKEVFSGAQNRTIAIKAPKFEYALFNISAMPGVPLVIHRFSMKTKMEIAGKMETGKASSSRKNRDPKDSDVSYNEARYRSPAGWDGFNASSIRKAMISACRLVNFKMTLAKLSIFVIADGQDALEPQIPLIRIYGEPRKQMDMARVETGQPYIVWRPAYDDWKAKVRIRWDADQFTLSDVSNLLARAGLQVGIGEGRPDSKNSAGMDWGLFEVARDTDEVEKWNAPNTAPSAPVIGKEKIGGYKPANRR